MRAKGQQPLFLFLIGGGGDEKCPVLFHKFISSINVFYMKLVLYPLSKPREILEKMRMTAMF